MSVQKFALVALMGILQAGGPLYGAIAASNDNSVKKNSVVKRQSTSSTASTKRGSSTKNSVKTVRTTTKKTVKPIRLKIEVPCRAWTPKNVQPKAVLLCVHGLGLNSASYQEFAKQMVKEGIGVFAVDVRGFGTWMQLKGKQKCDFESCISDVEQALRVLHTVYPNKPIFVLGESMGGAIAMRVTADHPDLVDGLISCVPSGDRFHKTKNQLRVALHLITLRGNKDIDVGTGVIEDATENEALRAKWKDDPLNRLKLSSKELMHFQSFMNDNHETAKRINSTPVLFVVGLGDKLVKPKGTIELYEEVSSEDKQMATIKNAEHLIFENHQISAELKGLIVHWLLKHKKKSR
jgi:alpha-beta hydrolase superfamily lysophospholipase